MDIPIYGLGSVGLNKDVAPHELEPQYLTESRNVVFRDGSIQRAEGQLNVYDPPRVIPYSTYGLLEGTTILWVYFGGGAAWAIKDQSHFNITRSTAAYGATPSASRWHGCMMGGIAYFNNGQDLPQVWLPPKETQVLADLPNFPVGVRAKALRAFKNFLFALGINEDGVDKPYLVWWSDPALPGGIPASWAFDDPSTLGRRRDVPTDGGFLVDGLALGEFFVIYQARAITAYFLTNDIANVFGERPLATEAGIMALGCVAKVGEKPYQLVATGDDLVTVDGQQVESIINGKLRSWLINRIDPENYANSFVVQNPGYREMWFCFPEIGRVYPSLALVWSWVHNTFSFRDLPDIGLSTLGVIDPNVNDTWDADPEEWNVDPSVWNLPLFAPVSRRILSPSPLQNKLYFMAAGSEFQGVDSPRVFAERLSIALPAEGGGPVKATQLQQWLCSEMWINASGAPLNFFVGVQETPEGPITWGGPFSYAPGIDRKIEPLVSGKLLSWRVESNVSAPWRLNSLELTLQKMGRY